MSTTNQQAGIDSATPITTTFSASKSFDTKTSLMILKEFYLEVRRELKKTNSTAVSLNADRECCNLQFKSEGFNLELNYTEGVKLCQNQN